MTDGDLPGPLCPLLRLPGWGVEQPVPVRLADGGRHALIDLRPYPWGPAGLSVPMPPSPDGRYFATSRPGLEWMRSVVSDVPSWEPVTGWWEWGLLAEPVDLRDPAGYDGWTSASDEDPPVLQAIRLQAGDGGVLRWHHDCYQAASRALLGRIMSG